LDVICIAFIGGAASFAHCLGMCGGFALHLAAGPSKAAMLARQLLWHFGRITTYVFLGALAGFLGNRISLAQWPWVRDLPGYLAGAVMIVMGLALLGLLPWRRTGARNADEGVLASAFRHFFGLPTPLSALALGLANGFLPCPITLAFLALAAQSGSVLMGMATMAAMGVGTVWSLLVLGMGGHMFKTHLRRWGAVVIGIALVLLGSWTILRKTGVLPKISGSQPPTIGSQERSAEGFGIPPDEQAAASMEVPQI
jgi:uncharacterized protein